MNTPSTSWKEQNCKNNRRLAFWTSIWLITMALANFGPKFLWQEENSLTLIAIALNLLVGFVMVWANKVQLQGLDEMQQRIQLGAMGLSLGVGLVVGLAYSNLDVNNIIGFDAEISHLVIVMGLTYLLGNVLGVRKYQ